MIFWLKTSIQMLRRLIFAIFSWFLEFHAKYGQKLENLVKSWIFYLIWHEIKKISQKSQKWAEATSKWMFWVKISIQKWFFKFCIYCSLIWKKSGKKRVFAIFSKNQIFGKKSTKPTCSWQKSLSTNVYFYVL